MPHTDQIKDYKHQSGIGNDLISNNSLLKRFKFTETLEFDQTTENVPFHNLQEGDFGKLDLNKGMELKVDKVGNKSFFQSKNFGTNGKGWRLDSNGNIISTQQAIFGLDEKMRFDSSTDRLIFVSEDEDRFYINAFDGGVFPITDGINSINIGNASRRFLNIQMRAQDEIDFRAESSEIFIDGSTTSGGITGYIPMTNKSGGSVTTNDVVVIDTANNQSFTTTTMENDPLVIGIAAETIANDAVGRIAVLGIHTILCDTNIVNRGDMLATSTTTKQAKSTLEDPKGFIIGKALTSKAAGSSGTVRAIIGLA